MKLKFKVKNLNDVDEKFRDLYTEVNGEYFLDVDGAVAKEKLDEFRNNNIELMREMEKYKDVDPAKYRELMSIQQKMEEKKLIDAGEIDKLVELRVNEMKKSHQSELSKLQEQLGTSNRQLEVLIIDNAVREHAVKMGVQPTAVDDVLLRAKTVFKVQDGKPVAFNPDGSIQYGKDGQNSIGISDYIGGLKEAAPHLFQPSQGSGSSNNNRGQMNNGQNLNPTQKIAAGLNSGSSILGG